MPMKFRVTIDLLLRPNRMVMPPPPHTHTQIPQSTEITGT
jgi:hypothetical protein